MYGWQTIYQNVIVTVDPSTQNYQQWRLLIALGILVVGFLILENHEGMESDFPPRVFFNEFNDASLNLIMLYWYHPPDWAAYMAFSERVNLQIMRAFEAEGIEFAFPTTTNYLSQDERRPLHIRLSSDTELIDQNA